MPSQWPPAPWSLQARLFWFLVLWIVVMVGYDCTSTASAKIPGPTAAAAREIVQAIDRNTKAIKDQARRCR